MSDEEVVVAEDEEAENEVEDEEVAADEPGNVGVSDDLQILNERLGAPVSDASGEPIEPAPEADELDIPTEDNTKDEIKAFLDEVGVGYKTSDNKDELLALVESWS